MQLKKILLRAPNWVGDTAVATPAMKAIRAKFPDAEITVMVRPSVTGVFASARYVDRVWTEPRPSAIREWLRIMMDVRRKHFDLAVLLQRLVFGDHQAADLLVFFDQLLLFFFRKVFPLFKKRFEEGIFFAPKRVYPGQVEPDLEIPPVFFFKVFLGPGEVF